MVEIMSLQVTLSLKEIYDMLCEKCKKKLKKKVMDKVAEQLAEQVLGVEN